jgi:divalent metal cation (Fe/Co/Zn/Cd) transporter
MPTSTDLERRGLRLEYLTIAWNVVEGIVSIAAGVAAGSIALVVFGLDSFIEVAAAGVVVWELRGVSGDRERTALRLIALTFYALAAYVAVTATRDLILAERPHESIPGIAIAVASLVVMPLLARTKRRTGQALHSTTLVADSKETLLCTYLSAILLAGLGLNAAFGWWWADPVAAYGIAVLAVREGREAWRGDACC